MKVIITHPGDMSLKQPAFRATIEIEDMAAWYTDSASMQQQINDDNQRTIVRLLGMLNDTPEDMKIEFFDEHLELD